MFRRLGRLGTAIAGLGLIGIIGVLTFLFGDNVVGRTFTFLFSAGPVSKAQPEVLPEPRKAEETPIPEETPGTSVGTATLYGKLCATKRIMVTFQTRPTDNPRYKRRAGTTIIVVPACFDNDNTFRTRVGGESAYDGEGIVAGNRIEFKYKYYDQLGSVDCRVVAVESDGAIGGTIACEGWNDAMESRKVALDIR